MLMWGARALGFWDLLFAWRVPLGFLRDAYGLGLGKDQLTSSWRTWLLLFMLTLLLVRYIELGLGL